ncbi:MAG TPA: N-acetylneuraminate synthase family protein [Pirellulales bacterium]|jgi:N-acetylneuraminate synthase|nr:N-acetylneuraminate synthase family protein [Pirellulales bacterium]
MPRTIELGGRGVGEEHPVYIIAEIGVNHNGSLGIARRLIDLAKASGCDAVKFQKRTPEKCVPAEMRDKMRETPWGYISYLEYRHKIEFGHAEFRQIDQYCRAQKIVWFASCWDVDSVAFLEEFNTPCLKVPSAALTDRELLDACRATRRPVMLSTGMSTMDQIEAAVAVLGTERLLLAHATSTYPCPKEELNLRMITTLAKRFDCPIGYSGHEVGLATSVAAIALGASFIERHITLDRAMWGSDQAASIEPQGLKRLVKDIRSVESAMGDGQKHVYPSEVVAASRLRLKNTLDAK